MTLYDISTKLEGNYILVAIDTYKNRIIFDGYQFDIDSADSPIGINGAKSFIVESIVLNSDKYDADIVIYGQYE